MEYQKIINLHDTTSDKLGLKFMISLGKYTILTNK